MTAHTINTPTEKGSHQSAKAVKLEVEQEITVS
jgi:hypothetical protein